MDSALSDLGVYWSEYIWPILQFVVGLGLMIFVHELGHFIVAKWVGIKVERFAIGMGPRVLGFQPGETDYCLCAVPVGGYVKMLGQEDFKAMEEGQQLDPRSYQAKSIGKRFGVIAAGVVMNLILAAVLFVIVGLVGKDFNAPVIGAVSPGSPASQAPVAWEDPPQGRLAVTKGLKPGDGIPRIEGDSVVQWICGDEIEHFGDLKLTSMVADPADTYTMTVERMIDGRTVIGKAAMRPRMGDMGVLMFGVGPAFDVVFGEVKGAVIDSPFQEGDRILRVAGREVVHLWDIDAIEKTLSGDAVTVTVRRGGQEVDVKVQPVLVRPPTVHSLKDGSIVRGEIVDVANREVQRTQPSGESKAVRVNELTLEQPDGRRRKILLEAFDKSAVRFLGMVPRIRVLLVREDYPADEVGVRPGDVVLSYGSAKLPSIGTLQDVSKSEGGQPIELIVLRGDKEETFKLAPKDSNDQPLIGITPAADLDHAVVGEIRKGSPAAEAGIPAGARLRAVGGTDVDSWYHVYHVLSAFAGRKVTIAYEYAGERGAAEIDLTQDVFRPDDYAWRVPVGPRPLKPLTVTIRQDGVLDSLAWGGKVTVKLVLSTYLSIRSLIRGWAPLEEARGPLGLGHIAVAVARESFMDFLYLLGFLSAAIAVFNFLPIPVVDGGHAVLLLIEKIRGKALSVRVMNTIQVVGLVLILGLFVAVTWNDILRLIRS